MTCIFILDIWLLWEVVWLGVSDGMAGECVTVPTGLQPFTGRLQLRRRPQLHQVRLTLQYRQDYSHLRQNENQPWHFLKVLYGQLVIRGNFYLSIFRMATIQIDIHVSCYTYCILCYYCFLSELCQRLRMGTLGRWGRNLSWFQGLPYLTSVSTTTTTVCGAVRRNWTSSTNSSSGWLQRVRTPSLQPTSKRERERELEKLFLSFYTCILHIDLMMY